MSENLAQKYPKRKVSHESVTLDQHAVTPESYDVLHYFVSRHESLPNATYINTTINNSYISYDKLLTDLLANGATILQKMTSWGFLLSRKAVRKVIVELDQTILILETIVQKQLDELTNLSDEVQAFVKDGELAIIGSMTTYHRSFDLPENIEEMIRASLAKVKIHPVINIVSRDANGFFLSSVRMEQQFSDEMELHYGSDFPKFHEKLVNKLATTTQGLTLLHGAAGTGKSVYIRKLITDLQELTSKKVILVPNNMIEYMTSPDFSTFMLEIAEIIEDEDMEQDEKPVSLTENKKEKGMILVLEDAEAVLMSREGGADMGTSSLLNLTSGILNDIYGTQIIATYNTDDTNIDKALMRSKRLIAKRKFDKLSVENAKRLAEHIGAETSGIKNEMSVADVYSLLDEEIDTVLITKPKEKSKKIGFN